MRATRAMLYALLGVALAAPAYAQINIPTGSVKKKTQDEIDAEKQRNEDYNAAMKKLPDQNAKSDPWGSLRGTGGGDQKQTGQKKQAAPKQADQKQKPAGAQ